MGGVAEKVKPLGIHGAEIGQHRYDVAMELSELPPSIANRIQITGNGCWEWKGSREAPGYGMVYVPADPVRGLPQRNIRIHRYVWELAIGRPPPGSRHQLDHLCRNRACCNPRHLELVTQRTNVLRGDSALAANARRTKCKRGHDLLDPQNVQIRTRQGRHPSRRCIPCHRIESREQSQRKAAARGVG